MEACFKYFKYNVENIIGTMRIHMINMHVSTTNHYGLIWHPSSHITQIIRKKSQYISRIQLVISSRTWLLPKVLSPWILITPEVLISSITPILVSHPTQTRSIINCTYPNTDSQTLASMPIIEGVGAPSQKTSLLGEVAQILINPRPSPRLADVGLFVRPKSQH